MKMTIRLDVATARRLKEELLDTLTRYDTSDDLGILEVDFIATGEFSLHVDQPEYWTTWR